MKYITLTLAATALLTLPSLSFAADEKPARRPGATDRVNPEERLKRMTEMLSLTQEQQDKIKALQEKNGPAMKELMAKGRENLTDDDKTKMREMMKTQMEETTAILTPEQKEKWKAEMEKRGGPGAPGGKRGERRPGADKPDAK